MTTPTVPPDPSAPAPDDTSAPGAAPAPGPASPVRRRLLKATAAGGAVAGFAGFSGLSHLFSSLLLQGDEMAAFQPPQGAETDEATHFLNRLTFGPRPADHTEIARLGTAAWLDRQLNPESIPDERSEARSRHFEALDVWPLGELMEYSAKELLDQMTRSKILRAVHSRRQLLEVMTDFWSDHFNIDPSKGDSKWLKPADDKLVIRANALGSFRTLLRASALSPSMLWYLDGRENRTLTGACRPNENYARELLELHTLGVDGGYTQQDVMETARCLTGWTVQARENTRFAVGRVAFDPAHHDDNPKTVLGTRIPPGLGAGDLDRVLEIVCAHPATAQYLARKLCRRFINDDPPAAAVRAVAEAFTASGGDIRRTLRALFATPEFLTARAVKVKRPFHFVVSALRAGAGRTDAGPALQNYLLRMGHAPFQYPTPDGYPEEAQPWMATLLWRWKFAAELASGRIKGSSLDLRRLARASGSPGGMAAHFLGRRPSSQESTLLAGCENPAALLIASPAFQVF